MEKPERKGSFKKGKQRPKSKFTKRRSSGFKKKNELETSGGDIIPEVLGFRLNRYIAQSGICSRREADGLIAQGKVRVNNKVISGMGYKVQAGDRVYLDGKLLNIEKLRYVLLNKPRDFITTTSDPQDRKTVMSLVSNACEERIYPVGRLDRNTSGLLLFTNDGDLSKKLTHPSSKIEKVYQVELDKPIQEIHVEKIMQGVELEDGPASVDDLVVLNQDHLTLGISLHIGKNRIVRRIFERLGYEVLKLDRVVFAGITKKNLPRGKWRLLTEKEVIKLKHF